MTGPAHFWPKLYGLPSSGKIKVWRIWATGEKDGTATIRTEHGREGGQLQETAVHILVGKNIGRSNETSPFEQASSEAHSKWQKKVDAQYVEKKEDLDKPSSILLPMLAHVYKEKKKHVVWPAYVQPKIDGIRCLAHKISEKKIEFTSRYGKVFESMDHLSADLLACMAVGAIFDGELYVPGWSLQKIGGVVKRGAPDSETGEVEFWVFDFVAEADFSSRIVTLTGVLEDLERDTMIIRVPAKLVKTEKAMERMHDQMVKAGYEGAMVRNQTGSYVFKHRTTNLLKVKDYEDDEFEIVGGKTGVGRDLDAVTFICVTEDGKRFDCKPRGSLKKRREWFKDLSKIIRKKLTVRYQYFTDDGIPFQPIGIVIRDYE